MSVEAITWALKQDAGMSSAKFVLVVMANCANGDDFVCRPSIAYLSSATGQNRKTVIANIQRLLDRNLIADTGKRAGATGQIHIYSMNVNSTKTGTVKESQKRNSSENGTVPKTDAKSPKNGTRKLKRNVKKRKKEEPPRELSSKHRRHFWPTWMNVKIVVSDLYLEMMQFSITRKKLGFRKNFCVFAGWSLWRSTSYATSGTRIGDLFS